MRSPVRTVCVACLHSLEVSSHEAFSGLPSCPYCGHPVEPIRSAANTPTTGDEFLAPPDPDALTPVSLSVVKTMPVKIGRFMLREPLGEGGYGEVFRAYDPHLERDVALKVLKPNRLGEKALERFYREARAAARLDHPNIVGLHDAGRDEHRCWIAYQLVTGQTLSMLRDLERPSIDQSVRIVRDLALALEHAHGRGVFHRDLKPANVLIDQEGRARLTDFGLARRNDLDSDLTLEGTILGTPQYMSPEAAAGRAHEADGRSDVYSLGVILYELICGRRPADVPSGAPLWRSTRIAVPPTPRSVAREIPVELDRISMKALAFDPEARYSSARAFADALGKYLQGRPISVTRMDSNRSSRSPGDKGGVAVGLISVASAVCLVLGMSLKVGVPSPSKVVQAPFASGLIAAGPGASNPLLDEAGLDRNPSSTRSRRTAQRPAIESTPDDLLDSPVVYIENTKEHKFHLKACQFVKKAKESRIQELGVARVALENGFNPCKSCLSRLNQPANDPPTD